LVGHN